MEVGKVYIVNTLIPHGVVNDGPTDRIHLMFDAQIDKD
jgi:hypothetical protein